MNLNPELVLEYLETTRMRLKVNETRIRNYDSEVKRYTRENDTLSMLIQHFESLLDMISSDEEQQKLLDMLEAKEKEDEKKLPFHEEVP